MIERMAITRELFAICDAKDRGGASICDAKLEVRLSPDDRDQLLDLLRSKNWFADGMSRHLCPDHLVLFRVIERTDIVGQGEEGQPLIRFVGGPGELRKAFPVNPRWENDPLANVSNSDIDIFKWVEKSRDWGLNWEKCQDPR